MEWWSRGCDSERNGVESRAVGGGGGVSTYTYTYVPIGTYWIML